MTFQRRILHHGPTPTGTPVGLSLQAVRKCWFELHRQGGCGSAELTLSSTFAQRDQIELGHWVSFESSPGNRWYLGRIEERSSSSPAQIRFRLEGMAIELNEIFPGGFGLQADGRRPHRYAGTDLFTHDPDRSIETYDSAQSVTDVVALLLSQYVAPATHVLYDPLRVEAPLQTASVTSLKFRGEESVRSILKELATRAQSASWGVDAAGTFFFLQPRLSPMNTMQEGVDITKLRESRDREYLFNRLLLTGDYVYDRRDQSNMIARRSYRWRGNFIEPISQSQHGDRRIRIWVPWIRTQNDSIAFAKEFFRSYSQPLSRFLIDTTAQTSLLNPWDGRITLLDQSGNLLTTAFAETIRVQFDHAPTFRMELGPIDPRNLWPEPPQDERWELPEQEPSAGGPVSLPSLLSIGNPSGGGGGGGGGGGSGSSVNSLSSGLNSFSQSSVVSSASNSSNPSFGISSTTPQSFFSSGGISSSLGQASSGGHTSSGMISSSGIPSTSSGWASSTPSASSGPQTSAISSQSSAASSSGGMNSQSSTSPSGLPVTSSSAGQGSRDSSMY